MTVPVYLRGTPEGLLQAWEEWDKQPGARNKVVQYQQELAEAATRIGITTIQARTQLVQARNQGTTRRQALRHLLNPT